MMSIKTNYTGAVQNLLYCHPLYDYINDKKVNILVFGFSDIAEKFIDSAFEMAQVCGYKLNITVISQKSGSEDKYLDARPAFRNFFSVDDETVEDDYGRLSFSEISFDDISEDIFEYLSSGKNGSFSYVFVGSDDDDWNYAASTAFADCRELLETGFVINCVAGKSGDDSRINYVLRDDSIEKHKDHKKLKAMAFNCHLVWNFSKPLDMKKLRRQFLADYNYVACFSYVISLKYKLNSIGIDFLDADAPAKFNKLINSDDSDTALLEDLTAGEHRRWNVNMICRGFRTADPKKYIDGIETKANGYHPCLVRGTGKQGLKSAIWADKSSGNWEHASVEDWKNLDLLDQVSVTLHSTYANRAKKIKCNNLIPRSDIDVIYKLLDGNDKAGIAFDKYCTCLQEIIGGVSSKTAFYEHCYSALLKELDKLPPNQAKIVTKRIKVLAESFRPILESEKYIDYKQYDVDLVRKIPFILTYRSNLHIGIPIDVMNVVPTTVNTSAFRLVETALLINPSKITYICDFENRDLNNLIKVLGYAVKSMELHHLRATINICLLTNYCLTEELISSITGISGRISSVETVKRDDFVEYAKRKHLKIFESNRTMSSAVIERNEYCRNSFYRYNRERNKFIATNCDEIKYIFFAPYLKVSDIFELRGSVDDYSFPDMQKDYLFFWNLYRDYRDYTSEAKWKRLCNILGSKNKKTQYIIENSHNLITKSYFVERAYLDSIVKLCRQMQGANKAVTCKVELYSNNSYKVKIKAPVDFVSTIDLLLGKVYFLYDPNSINLFYDKENKNCFIKFDSLETGLIEPEAIDFDNTEYIETLLRKLEENGYIRNLRWDNEKGMSFTYSTHQVKNIMTQAGRVLELYVYYSIYESGLFDDVANSVEICWGEGADTQNEFDIIAISGYRVLLIECKAQNKLEQEFYNKLSRLNSEYGLNSTPVIVADITNKSFAEHNNEMIELGNNVGIYTIFEKSAFSNIANRLKGLISK